jgi:hypothetical protein
MPTLWIRSPCKPKATIRFKRHKTKPLPCSVSAIGLGAFDALNLPIDERELLRMTRRAVADLSDCSTQVKA